MERDLDLIKNILLALEKDEKPFVWKTKLIDTEDKIKYHYHIRLLGEAGLVKVEDTGGNEWVPYSLTWHGHEFLDAAKNDKAWNKVKETIRREGVSLPFSILKEILFFTIRTGLESFT